MASCRILTDAEKMLIAAMVKDLPIEPTVLSALHDARVEEMNDGGMGSLRFIHSVAAGFKGLAQVREATFADRDGVSVSITLNVDGDGRLFELDVFKADNSPLRTFPAPEDTHIR